MEISFRSAIASDASRIAEIYFASRKTILSFAPLAHSDEEVGDWIRQHLIPQGVTVAVLDEGI
ncbi:MAG TPA: hypothetical protein VGB77_03140, partial [Abditibacteriaceae bacterium]